MKTVVLIAAMIFSVNLAMADDSEYLETMMKNIDLIYRAKTLGEVQQAANAFDRIANAEKTKWEPFYYASFGYIMMATMEQDVAKKDALLDQAKVFVDKAATLKANDSEIGTLEGFISTMRVSVDPATRGQQYGGLAMQAFGKALAVNPDNPRALALMAQMQFGTARFFNSSTAEACATVSKSLEKYDLPKSADPLAPTWGKGMAQGLRKQCQ